MFDWLWSGWLDMKLREETKAFYRLRVPPTNSDILKLTIHSVACNI